MVTPRRGFTLIELVIVIAIIGILASLSVPKFLDMSTEAKVAKAKAGLGAVRAALATYYANSATGGAVASYPAALSGGNFADGTTPVNPLSVVPGTGIRSFAALPTHLTDRACMGFPQKDFWFVTNPASPDYGKAGACTDMNDSYDMSTW